MTSFNKRAFCILMFGAAQIALCAVPSRALAQRTATDIESARQLYNQGIELRDSGDIKGALEKFRAAHALGNTPITGLELCKAYATVAQPVEAREVCLGVGRIPPLAGETARSTDARNEAARVAEEMTPRIAIVTIRITGVPAGREPTVLVDRAPVPIAAIGEARALNPGKHEVTARVGRGAETSSIVEVVAGERKDITLPVQAPPPEDDVPPPGTGQRAPAPERSNRLAIAGFVVGGVGVGIGLIAGGVALSKKDDLETACPGKVCGRESHDDLSSAKTWGDVSTASFIIGGAGLLVGIYAVVTAPSTPRASASANDPPPLARDSHAARRESRRASSFTITPDFGPAGVGVHGSF